MIGPLIALTLFGILSFTGLFLLAFIPGALAAVLVIFFVKETAGKQGGKEFHKVSFSVFDRDLQVFLLGLALFFVGNSSDAFLFLRAQNLGVPTLVVPALYLVKNVIMRPLRFRLELSQTK